MNDEELRSTIEQIKAQVKAKPENKDKSDDEIDEIILDGFYDAFADGKMEKEDLIAIAEALGYEPTEEFEKEEGFAAPEAPAEGEGEEGGLEDISKEDLEEARTIDEGESKEDFKDKIESLQEGEKPVEKPEAEPEEESEEEVEEEDETENYDDEEEEEEIDDEDEEAQRKKAAEIFKW